MRTNDTHINNRLYRAEAPKSNIATDLVSRKVFQQAEKSAEISVPYSERFTYTIIHVYANADV